MLTCAAIAFETEADDLEVLAAIHAGKAHPIPPQVVDSGPCQEVVQLEDDVDALALWAVRAS